MIVITDGESHDSADLKQAIEDSEKDGITRYAIAVSLSEQPMAHLIPSTEVVSLGTSWRHWQEENHPKSIETAAVVL